MPEHRLKDILRALYGNHVEFILVGGVAAVLQGAPVDTFDVDVVHSRTAQNIARLLSVLESIEAVFRLQPERRLKPTTSHLAGPGHLNLITRYGPLDVLGTIGRDLAYQDLLPRSTAMDIGEGMRIQVLDLETLIEIKADLHADKDRAVLPILRRTLEQKRKSEDH